MRANRPAHRVLVPIFDGDISDATLTCARAALADPDTRLVLLHVVAPPGRRRRLVTAEEDDGRARWRRLAADARPDHVLVDAVVDAPTHAIASYAERFGCDLILADRPTR